MDKRHPEPFVKLLPQGMVTGQSFKIKATGQYVHPKEAELDDDQKMVNTGWMQFVILRYPKTFQNV